MMFLEKVFNSNKVQASKAIISKGRSYSNLSKFYVFVSEKVKVDETHKLYT